MKRGSLTAGVLMAAAVLSACTDGGDTEPGTATITETSAAATTESARDDDVVTTTEDSPTTEPPQLSAEEQDEADVEATVLGFVSALDAAYVDGDIEGIYPWSRDAARDTWTTQLMAYKEQGLTFEADRGVELLSIEVQGDQADVTTCLDYTETKVTDAEGKDITPERASGDLILNDYVLEREPSAEYGWIVVDDISKSEPCDG